MERVAVNREVSNYPSPNPKFHRKARGVQFVLAKILNGTVDVEAIPVPTEVTNHRLNSSRRVYDVIGRTPYSAASLRELKVGNERCKRSEILKDVYLMTNLSLDLSYDFVPNPLTGGIVAQRDLDTLDYWGIPWKVWNPSLFASAFQSWVD